MRATHKENGDRKFRPNSDFLTPVKPRGGCAVCDVSESIFEIQRRPDCAVVKLCTKFERHGTICDDVITCPSNF